MLIKYEIIIGRVILEDGEYVDIDSSIYIEANNIEEATNKCNKDSFEMHGLAYTGIISITELL